MPTYEYRCEHCDRTFDVVQSFHDDALTACPTCGNPVRKVFGNVGIVFKGSGFYKTDSRTGGGTKTKESVASTSAGGDGGSTSSGDSAGSSDSSAASTDTKTESATPSGSDSKSATTTPATTPSSTGTSKAT